MKPNSLKGFVVFVDGVGYGGVVTQGTPPKVAIKVEEHLAGGMAAPIDVDTGVVEKMTYEFTLAEYNPAVTALLGRDGISVTFRLAQGLNDAGAEAVIIETRGLLREADDGSPQAGGKTELKIAGTADYYKKTIAGSVIVEIDAINMVRKINGVDQLASQRRALGLSN